MGQKNQMELEKNRVIHWFKDLRDVILKNFENLEHNQEFGKFQKNKPGRFDKRKTSRLNSKNINQGGGEMAIMSNGRRFEKVGVNISSVYGELSNEAIQMMTESKNLPHLKENPSFWASGISLVAHMQNPHLPAVHMNTRMFWTKGAWWFGGGADLNPCIELSIIHI